MFIVYLTCKFNWASSVLSGNPICKPVLPLNYIASEVCLSFSIWCCNNRDPASSVPWNFRLLEGTPISDATWYLPQHQAPTSLTQHRYSFNETVGFDVAKGFERYSEKNDQKCKVLDISVLFCFPASFQMLGESSILHPAVTMVLAAGMKAWHLFQVVLNFPSRPCAGN